MATATSFLSRARWPYWAWVCPVWPSCVAARRPLSRQPAFIDVGQCEINMKFIDCRSSVILAVLGLLMATTLAQAASFSDEQIKEHPCLDKASLPWRISPAKTTDIPEAYKG